jgi:hypothetical protein
MGISSLSWGPRPYPGSCRLFSFVIDVATYFHREPAMISQGVMKVEGLLQTNGGLAEKVEMAGRKLIRNRGKKHSITYA